MCRGLLVLNLGSGFAFLNLFFPTLDSPELTFEQPPQDLREPTVGLQSLPVPGGEGNTISAKEQDGGISLQ